MERPFGGSRNVRRTCAVPHHRAKPVYHVSKTLRQSEFLSKRASSGRLPLSTKRSSRHCAVRHLERYLSKRASAGSLRAAHISGQEMKIPTPRKELRKASRESQNGCRHDRETQSIGWRRVETRGTEFSPALSLSSDVAPPCRARDIAYAGLGRAGFHAFFQSCPDLISLGRSGIMNLVADAGIQFLESCI